MPSWDDDEPTAWDTWLADHSGAVALASLIVFALVLIFLHAS